MQVAIIGTRGIPNHYGGFEQCAEYMAEGLVKRGFDITVYNSHNHPYQESEWHGVKIVHCFDPEYKLGTAGQFIYDLNCILDSRKRNFDVILQLGYTSNSIWGWLLPRKSVVTTNMDGLEWKRAKYSRPVQKFLLLAEKLAVNYSDYLISDSIGIGEYLFAKYKKESVFIPYGACLFDNKDWSVLSEFGLSPYQYDMLISRPEPENSIEIILDGYVNSDTKRKFLVVGNYDNKYGQYIRGKYKSNPEILFVGGVYDINKLNNLRTFSNLYFHGHSVGGTNPSLLEAMASSCLICAHDNPFNKYILEGDAFYFQSVDDVTVCLNETEDKYSRCQHMIENNRQKIHEIYSWEKVVDKYASHLLNITSSESLYPVESKLNSEKEVRI